MRALSVKFVLGVLLLFIITDCLSGQAFPCNGKPIITLHQNAPPNYSHWVQMNESGEVEFQELATFNDLYFNAVGYNRYDNYIYANRKNTNQIVRLKADGSFEVVGDVPLVSIASTGAGDCTPEGLYVYRENTINKLLFFEVINDFELVAELEMYWDNANGLSGVFEARIDDIAFDPFQPGVAYSYLRNYAGSGSAPLDAQGALIRINVDLDSPNAGAVTIIGEVPDNIVRHIGALFFDTQGNLFGYGSLQGMPNLFQNRLVGLNSETGEAVLLGTGPGATGNDGCSCPYDLVFEKTIDQDTLYCNTESLVFNLSIESRHHETIFGTLLRDTLPDGMMIEEVITNLPTFEYAPSTGPGTRILAMDGVTLESVTPYEVQIKVRLDQLPPGNYHNQAFLYNLPVSLGSFKLSDDKGNALISEDPTLFTVLSNASAEIVSEVIPPSNCTEANGGIILYSSFFESNRPFLINVRDEEQNVWTIELTPDTDSLIILTGLAPGVYAVESVSDLLQGCTLYANFDFTLPSPNHLIGLSADNNGPTCEEESIQLIGQSDLDATLSWYGPGGFLSNFQNPEISPTTFNNSGDYILQAQYGFCQAQDTTYVDIKPAINLEVEDTVTVCLGSNLELEAKGALQNTSVFWLLPNSEVQVSSILNLPSLTPESTGNYFVEAVNDWCSDSSSFHLAVITPPQITLAPTTSYNYCEFQTLKPFILDSTGYIETTWSPSIGLSCNDCIFPELVSPENGVNYTLTVINEYNCIDSATTQIDLFLDKSIYVPNAFSPNGDRVNDYFTIYPGCGVRKVLKFLIFDKWGNEVFKAESFDPHLISPSWDGYTRNTKQNIKVFTWLIEVEFLNGATEIMTGDVQIIR